MPPWRVGSGGHTTIFRLIRQLELRGHRCAIFVFDPFGRNYKNGATLRREIREHFIEIDAPVFRGLDDFTGADICVATECWTAFPVRDLPNCREKVYLVQDHEREFYATSAESLWAEETYRMGFRCIAYTPWMADLLEREYGRQRAGSSAGPTSTRSRSPRRRSASRARSRSTRARRPTAAPCRSQ